MNFWNAFCTGFFRSFPHRHRIYPTGRRGIEMYQVWCSRCHRMFAAHMTKDYLLEWDYDLEMFAKGMGW